MVLRSSPNVTALEFDRISCPMDSVEITPTLMALVPNVTAINNGSAVSFRSLKLIGPQLKELRTNRNADASWTDLLRTCPLLEVLEVRSASLALIIDIVEACISLRDLHLMSSVFSEDDIASILTQRQLRRLTVAKISTSSINCQRLANLMTLFPDTEYLCLNNMGRCLYSREDGKLVLGGQCAIDGALMTQLLDACRSVRFLTIYAAIHDDAAQVITRKLGNRLERFSLFIHQAPHLDNLQTCGPLVHLIHLSMCDIADAMLEAIAAHCPLLESLLLMNIPGAGTLPSVTDEGLGMLFGACQNLNELSLVHSSCIHITRKTLQTVVDHKLRLKTLNVYGPAHINQHDVDWFRQEVREYLLPVTTVCTTWN